MIRTLRIVAFLVVVMSHPRVHGAPALPQTPGAAEAQQALQQAVKALQEQRYADAEKAARKAVTLFEKHAGKDNEYVGLSLHMLSSALTMQGRSAETEPLQLRSLAIQEKVYGKDNPSLVLTLINLATLRSNAGDNRKAVEHQARAVKLLENTPGLDFVQIVPHVATLAAMLEAAGAYADALQWRERMVAAVEKYPEMKGDLVNQLLALAINHKNRSELEAAEKSCRRALLIADDVGAESIEAAHASGELAEVLRERGNYVEARGLYARAMTLEEKHGGAESAGVARVQSNHALLLHRTGEHFEAEALYRRSIAIREKVLGADHLELSYPLNNLAELLRVRARFDEAEPLYRRALAIRQKHLGRKHPLAATALQNLALLESDRGDDAAADRLYREALGIYEGTVGPDHHLVATVLSNMALFSRSRGDLDGAYQHLTRALAIQEKTFGPVHMLVANTLNSIGLVALDAGNLDLAEPYLKRALEVREQVYGPDHVEVAMSRLNLSAVAMERGGAEEALAMAEQALAVFERAYGPQHPLVGSALNLIGSSRMGLGQQRKAIPLLEKALAVRAAALGESSPQVAETLYALGQAHFALGKLRPAMKAMERLTELREARASRAMGAGSDEEKRIYNSTLTHETHMAVSLAAGLGKKDRGAHRLALTAVLRWKARALDFMSHALGSVRTRMKPEDAALLDELGAVRTAIGALALRGPESDDVDTFKRSLAELDGRARGIEAELSARSMEYRATFEPVTLSAVQAAVPADAALVEYLVLPLSVRNTRRGVLDAGSWRFMAYVLRSKGAPELVDLGDAVEIEAIRVRFTAALTDPGSDAARAAGAALEERLVRPLRKKLKGVKTLLVAPDATLNLLPFGALVDQRGRWLLEEFHIVYLSSGRDLLRLKLAAATDGADVLIANPAFDDTTAPGRSTTRSGMFAGVRFDPLPGTADEAHAIAALMPSARLVEGKAATEGVVKKLRAPRILHIATHGFFANAEQTPAEGTRGLKLKKAAPPSTEPEPAARPARVIPPDALLRSGIALSGANTGGGDGDDGILTAFEVSGMDLWGTNLVVLSACQTGQGDLVIGDGVQGLRRALVVNGAQTQVMSLWNVDDEATRDLMTAFYGRLLKGEGRAEALRQAQLELLKGKHTAHPYYWAAFISAGDWRPLDVK